MIQTLSDKVVRGFRRVLLAVAGNESLFFFAAFLNAAVITMEPLAWYGEQTRMFGTYVIVPWGMALCLLRLARCVREERRTSGDVAMLGALFVWLVVPFAVRFGLTFNNMVTWCGYAAVFFAVYAAYTEEAPDARRRLFSLACMLLTVLALVWGAVLLHCALTGKIYGMETGGCVFGVQEGFLQCGLHYNITGMIAVCLCMISLANIQIHRNVMRFASVIPAAMMMLVAVLTQSRTARYSLLLALGVGLFAALYIRLPQKKAALRMGVCTLCALVVVVGGYVLAAKTTDAALAHYVRLAQSDSPAQAVLQGMGEMLPSAAAQEEEPAPAEASVQEEPVQLVARDAVDSTFSDRTTIWKNVFAMWMESPWHMMIGNGAGNTGSKIVEGTIHQDSGAVAVHNTYLQFMADFGWIGFALQLGFLLMLVKPVLRVLFAPQGACPGGRALCMLIVACLATGMMESAPLGQMTPMNLMLFFALAHVRGMDREKEQA